MNKDKKVCVEDIKKVLAKIKASKNFTMCAEDIFWEQNLNGSGYFKEKDLVDLMKRVVLDQKNGSNVEPTRLANIVDFVSKDLKLIGFISARQCIMLLHSRMGG